MLENNIRVLPDHVCEIASRFCLLAASYLMIFYQFARLPTCQLDQWSDVTRKVLLDPSPTLHIPSRSYGFRLCITSLSGFSGSDTYRNPGPSSAYSSEKTPFPGGVVDLRISIIIFCSGITCTRMADGQCTESYSVLTRNDLNIDFQVTLQLEFHCRIRYISYSHFHFPPGGCCTENGTFIFDLLSVAP